MEKISNSEEREGRNVAGEVQCSDAHNADREAAYSFLEQRKEWFWQLSSLSGNLFQKWNLTPGLIVRRFRINNSFGKREEKLVLRDFLKDESVLSSLGCPSNMSKTKGDNGDDILMQPLSCQVMNMKFFEPLYQSGIISDTEYIRGCFDIDIDGITMQDKLRELLANPDSDNAHAFSVEDRNEFLFHILCLVCIGGSMCQTEDRFTELKAATKEMYKDLITIKREKSGKVEITSAVYHIDPKGGSRRLFPISNIHNKFYAIIDREERIITAVSKPFKPFW
mmetsp:Transcript_29740/g.43894  ORF Transcript_29740/g.43894 Transcript_29740/m.43894 type:complete len:280 (-) Transcript_29740:1603-2442(-)